MVHDMKRFLLLNLSEPEMKHDIAIIQVNIQVNHFNPICFVSISKAVSLWMKKKM